MAQGQEYKVKLVYAVEDKAGKALGEIDKAARKAAESTTTLKQMFMGLGATHLAESGFKTIKSLVLDYNSSLEDSKTVISGMLSLFTGASIDKTWDRAAISVERFQQMAAKSSLTTKELVETAQGLTRPLIQVGVKMTDIENITFGVANAAKAFGMSGAVVSMDIEQALRGGVGERDRFIKSMLAQKGIELSGDQFNAKNQAERIAILKKALTSPAITAMAEKQAGTFSGVLSTLEDNLQIALGKVGMPLFKAITEEVKSWNGWMDKNGRKMEEWGKIVGQYLVDGFKTAKSAVSWIIDHADTLITIGKIWAGIKIAGAVGGGLGGSISGMIGGLGGLGKLGENVTGKGFLGNLGAISSVGTASYMLTTEFMKLTGASKALHEFVVGKAIVADERLTEQVKALDNAMANAHDKYKDAEGARGTAAFSNLVGATDMKKQQLNMFQDLLRYGARYNAEMQTNSVSSATAQGLKHARDALEGMGFDPEMGMTAIADKIGKLTVETKTLEYRKQLAQYATDQGLNEVLKGVTKEQLSVQQRQLITQQIMAENIAAIANGRGPLTQEGIKEVIQDMATFGMLGDVDALGQAKPPQQNITINIQQMSAKDPNRWLADMDDMVARRNRSSTRAKRAFKSSPQ